MNKVNICLIGGTGRSGTSILRKIFANHPKVARVPEWRGNIDPDGPIDFYISLKNGWSPHFFEVKVNRLERYLKKLGNSNIVEKAVVYLLHKIGFKPIPVFPYKLSKSYALNEISRYSPNYTQHCNNLIENLVDFSFKGQWIGTRMFQPSIQKYSSEKSSTELANIFGKFYRDIVNDILQHSEADYYVEDNTWNFLWFDYILELLPEAKLVHIYRDPRDVVASYRKQRWAPYSVRESAVFYRDLTNRWWKIREKLPSNSFIELSLEELVENSESTIKKISDFWGIPFDENLLNIDLSKSNKDRWKRDFSNDEKEILNDVLKDVIQKLNYDK